MRTAVSVGVGSTRRPPRSELAAPVPEYRHRVDVRGARTSVAALRPPEYLAAIVAHKRVRFLNHRIATHSSDSSVHSPHLCLNYRVGVC
jgi:hypothetical protein